MLDRLQREAFWADDYEEYVRQVSYAKIDEKITFVMALDATRVLIEEVAINSTDTRC